ncbi:MAG: dihydrodipicolinate synthase family protein [Pseudorhodoplanes sp.]|uniref:dihydrodipicolinate synthase family protein n=1 Tax=Pseudorhodoplanes sp. TaxID=1934341 RepID=UPI003D0EF49C
MQYSRSTAKDFARKHFRGIWAAIPTPFDHNDEIDERALRRDLRHYVDVLHIDGLFFGGVVGEFWALTFEERKRLHEIVLDELGDGCMSIAHTACTSLRDTVALTQHAQEHGSTFAVCVNPPCNPSRPEISISFFKTLCREVDLGVSLFNNSIAGYSLSSETIARLADIENIVSVKEATLDQLSETRRLAGDRIQVFDPVEDRLCENIIAHGDQCFMSSPYPFLLQSTGQLSIRDYAAKAWAGDHDGARRLSASLDTKRRVLHKWLMAGGFDSSIPVIKFISEHIGLTGGSVRAPMSRMTHDQESELRRDLEAVGLGEVRAAAE